MSEQAFRQYKTGTRISDRLTVLGVVAKVRGRHPVYIVWDHQGWCPLACKIGRSMRRAEQEAKVLDDVAHPNIVRGMGAVQPGLVLMEFLEGPTVAEHIVNQRAGRMTLPDAIRTAIHLGAALERSHAAGVLHMDVKPANVILASGRPVLYDFGSARRIGEARPGIVVGTDPYIAPEECRLEPCGPAADVFSLAVSLYEMLTGRLPFRESRRAGVYPQVTEPPAPLRAHLPQAPAGLDRLLMACLSADPQQRPTLRDLLPALHGFVRRGPRMWPEGFQPGGMASAATWRGACPVNSHTRPAGPIRNSPARTGVAL